jgi:hypothetical protein
LQWEAISRRRIRKKEVQYFHILVEVVDFACVTVAGALKATEQIWAPETLGFPEKKGRV